MHQHGLGDCGRRLGRCAGRRRRRRDGRSAAQKRPARGIQPTGAPATHAAVAPPDAADATSTEPDVAAPARWMGWTARATATRCQQRRGGQRPHRVQGRVQRPRRRDRTRRKRKRRRRLGGIHKQAEIQSQHGPSRRRQGHGARRRAPTPGQEPAHRERHVRQEERPAAGPVQAGRRGQAADARLHVRRRGTSGGTNEAADGAAGVPGQRSAARARDAHRPRPPRRGRALRLRRRLRRRHSCADGDARDAERAGLADAASERRPRRRRPDPVRPRHAQLARVGSFRGWRDAGSNRGADVRVPGAAHQARLPVPGCAQGALHQQPGVPTHRFGQDAHSGCRDVQLLQVVPQGKDRFPGAHAPAGGSTEGGVQQHMRHTHRRHVHDDGEHEEG